MRGILKKHIVWGMVVLMGALAGCSGTGPSAGGRQSSRGASNLTEEERIKLQYIFFNAHKEKILGNTDKAVEMFAECIRIDNRHAASMYELAGVYAGKKKFNDALFFANGAAEIDPGNEWYQLLLATLYRETGKYKEAVEVHERLVKENPDRLAYYFNLADALVYAGRLPEAIGVLDQVEERTGVKKELIIQKQRLYLKLGKTEKAAAELEKLIASDPKDLNAYSLLVDLYQANDMDDRAYETIERMRAINPESPHVFLALAEYYRSQGESDKSFEQLRRAFRSDLLNSDIKLRIIGSYFPLAQQDEKMMTQALELGKILAEQHPNEPMPLTAYAEFLTLAEQYKEANEQYRKVLELDKSNENVWQQYVVNTEYLRDYDHMHTATDEAMELFPNNPLFYLYNGLARGGKDDYEGSVRVLESGAKIVVDNDAILAQFHRLLGDHYHELEKHTDSDRNYDKALELEPTDAYTLNNYSYYLSLRKVRLEKAARMSLRSNELMPGQASFEDTYGWIKYQQGEYTEAKIWLERAMEHGGDNNGTILEHYGDVLFKLDDVTGAVNYWQKARTAGDGSDLLDKKIAERKLYE